MMNFNYDAIGMACSPPLGTMVAMAVEFCLLFLLVHAVSAGAGAVL